MDQPWYFSNPNIRGLFDRMAGLPEAYQRHIADEMCRSMGNGSSGGNSMDSLKSLGVQTVLGMMKFRSPSYWFNRDSAVRNAVLGLPSLPLQQQQDLLIRLSLSLAMLERLSAQNSGGNPDEMGKRVISNIFMKDSRELARLTRPGANRG